MLFRSPEFKSTKQGKVENADEIQYCSNPKLSTSNIYASSLPARARLMLSGAFLPSSFSILVTQLSSTHFSIPLTKYTKFVQFDTGKGRNGNAPRRGVLLLRAD